MIKGQLDQSALKGYTIVPSGATAGRMCAVNAWTTPVMKRVQYDRYPPPNMTCIYKTGIILLI